METFWRGEEGPSPPFTLTHRIREKLPADHTFFSTLIHQAFFWQYSDTAQPTNPPESLVRGAACRAISIQQNAPDPAPGRRIPPGHHLPRFFRLVDLNLAASDLFQASRSFICRTAAEAPLPDKSRTSERAARSASFSHPPVAPCISTPLTPGLPSESRRFRLTTFAGDPHPNPPFSLGADRLIDFYRNPFPLFSLASPRVCVLCRAPAGAAREGIERSRPSNCVAGSEGASWASAEARGRE